MKLRSWLSLSCICLLLVVACAPKSRHVATVSAVAAHGALALLQDSEMALVCGRQGAPAPPQCVSETAHKDISARLVKAFEYDKAYAVAIRDWDPSKPRPSNVVELVAQISEVINFVLDHIPPSPFKDKLLFQIRGPQS